MHFYYIINSTIHSLCYEIYIHLLDLLSKGQLSTSTIVSIYKYDTIGKIHTILSHLAFGGNLSILGTVLSKIGPLATIFS